MTPDDEKQLFDRLIRQPHYPGGTCPAEHVLVAYESGALPDDQRARVAEHLAECSGCRADFESLAGASRWFRTHEAQIRAGITDKGAAEGLAPWWSCPTAVMLRRFLEGAIPDSGGGRALRAEINRHLAECPDCDRAAKAFLATKMRTVDMWDLATRLDASLLGALREFVHNLVMTAQARGLPVFVRAAPGYRGAQELPDLVAPVLGPDGKVLVDEQGKPRQCRFRVVEASLKPDGFLMIYLTAADREYHAQGDHCYSASLSIQADYVRLVLPETPIDDRGRVTFTGQLPVAVAVDPLPLSAVDVTVRRGSPMASRGAVH